MNRKRFNTEEDKDILLAAKRDVDNEIISLRQAAEFIQAKTGKSISHEGLRKIFMKVDVDERRVETPPVGSST
jgi:hypothetical protein